jgi:hypothetical protein
MKSLQDIVGQLAGDIFVYEPREWEIHNQWVSYSAFRSLRCWETPNDEHYFMPAILSGSDYSGSLVEKSNFEVFTEEFDKHEDVLITYCGYGTYAVALRLGLTDQEIISTLERLIDYPLLDEMKLSEMELVAQEEAWESWVRRDFIVALEQKFDCELDDYDEDLLFQFFTKQADAANEYWVNEQSDEMWINLDRIVESIDELPPFLLTEVPDAAP